MRKILLFTAICILAITKSFANSGYSIQKITENRVSVDTLSPAAFVTYLTNLDLTQFVGHPVDSLLNLISNAVKTQKIYPCKDTKNGLHTACQLRVDYYGNINMRIFVKEFTHITPYDITNSWNISDFRQEKIACIVIWIGHEIVNDICD